MWNFSLLSQTGDPNGFQTPNFSPKSPEAGAFLRYGEYPVDLSTGLTNISLPIHTIQAGSFELPISLNYHSSGIKVSDEATWVGLGWNLNAGAQIILDVRDAPDEYNPSYDILPNSDDVRTYMSNNPLGYYHNYFQNLKQESWVRDIYNFSSPTANGKFVIDNFSAKEITVYPPDAFKVELEGSVTAKRFKITDQYGNIYHFDTTSEYSQTLQQYQPPMYTSAWFVDKIETPKHDVIEFFYIDGGEVTQYNYGETINHTKILIPNHACIPDAIPHQETISPTINSTSRLFTATKKINQIVFKEGRIVFNSDSGRLDFYDPNNITTLTNGPKKLNSIEIQRRNGITNEFTTLKKIQFYYSYFDSNTFSESFMNTHRLKLDKISNILGIDDAEETIFTYSDVQLPSQKSNSVDYWGYYNGIGNGSMIPRQVIRYSPWGISTSYESIGNADRRVSVSNIEAGILKEIKYPTKGRTRFEYEPNMYYGVDKMNKFTEHIVDGSHLVQGTGVSLPVANEATIDEYTTSCEIGCIQYLVLPFVAINAEAILNVQIRNSSPSGQYDPTLTKNQYGRVRIFDSTGNVYDSNKQTSTINILKNNFIINGTGFIVIEAYGQYMSVVDTQLKYYNNDPNPKNNYGMGLRIKSITNLDYTDKIITKKEYEYTNNQNLSSGVLINDALLAYQSNSVSNYFASCCSISPEPGVGGPFGCEWGSNVTASYNSNSINGIESNSVVYSEVKEKNIDENNVNNGYSIYRFSTDMDFLHDTRGIIKIDLGYKRGKLLSKEVFKEISLGNSRLVNKLTNEYKEDNRKISIVKGFKLFQHSYLSSPLVDNTLPVPLNTIFEPVGYNIPVSWFYQKSSESTDYFYDSNNVLTGSVTNRTNYFYDNPNHLQLTRTETTISNNEILKTLKFYPDDLAGNPLMTVLKAQNRIGEVIKTETFKGTTPLSAQNKVYKDWGNNLIEPEIIQVSKGSGAFDNKLQYNFIDNTNGAVLQYTLDNSIPVSIIWGYNKTQPIAKIESATYASITPSLITAVQTASDTGTETSLLIALTSLRNALPAAMVTTYTYKTLVGVSTITDPKGNTTYYEYDENNRLRLVKDAQGNILSENQYHYKN
ncbi:hypothetical protein B0E44_04495 [Flavobacterium sp. A45]|nr:hypothetical protein B0E44_04495 [Flavobacterium sp. A45]